MNQWITKSQEPFVALNGAGMLPSMVFAESRWSWSLNFCNSFRVWCETPHERERTGYPSCGSYCKPIQALQPSIWSLAWILTFNIRHIDGLPAFQYPGSSRSASPQLTRDAAIISSFKPSMVLRHHTQSPDKMAGRRPAQMQHGKLKVTFHTEYRTRWGENVVVYGDCPELGKWQIERGKMLRCQEKKLENRLEWDQTIMLSPRSKYSYRCFLEIF